MSVINITKHWYANFSVVEGMICALKYFHLELRQSQKINPLYAKTAQ